MIMEGREQSRGKQQGQRRLGRRTWGPGVGSGVGESPESGVSSRQAEEGPWGCEEVKAGLV